MNNYDDAAINESIRSKLADEKAHSSSSFRERTADKVADFGGSWKFIGLFSLFFALWVILNTHAGAFDGYPYILLNLILSCLSVFQAPFILMSQNRMAEIDRKRAEEDYKINLRAEMEIKFLHEKIDALTKMEDYFVAPVNCEHEWSIDFAMLDGQNISYCRKCRIAR